MTRWVGEGVIGRRITARRLRPIRFPQHLLKTDTLTLRTYTVADLSADSLRKKPRSLGSQKIRTKVIGLMGEPFTPARLHAAVYTLQSSRSGRRDANWCSSCNICRLPAFSGYDRCAKNEERRNCICCYS